MTLVQFKITILVELAMFSGLWYILTEYSLSPEQRQHHNKVPRPFALALGLLGLLGLLRHSFLLHVSPKIKVQGTGELSGISRKNNKLESQTELNPDVLTAVCCFPDHYFSF